MATIGAINISVRGNTMQFHRAMKRVRLTALTTARSVIRVFSPMSAQFVGVAAAVYGLARAFNSSEGLNRAMQSSLSIAGDVSDQMRKRMRDLAIQLSGETVFSSKKLAETYFELFSANLEQEQALRALPIVARFAQAGQFDPVLATKLLTTSTQAMGLASKDTEKQMASMARVADVLAQANIIAEGGIEDFAQALSTKSAAAFRIFGKTLEEVVAVSIAFHKQNVQGALGGTQLTIVQRDLTQKFVQFEEEFKKLNITVFDGNGKLRHFWEILKDIENAMANASDKQKVMNFLQLEFQNRSRTALLQLLGFSDKMKEWHDRLQQAGGKTKEISDKVMTPFQEKTRKLAEAWQKFSDVLTKQLMPSLIGLTDQLTVTLNAMTEFGDGITSGIIPTLDQLWSTLDAVSDAFSPIVDAMLLAQGIDPFQTANEGASEFAGVIAFVGDILYHIETSLRMFEMFMRKVFQHMTFAMAELFSKLNEWLKKISGGRLQMEGSEAFFEELNKNAALALGDAAGELALHLAKDMPSEVLAKLEKERLAIQETVWEEPAKKIAKAGDDIKNGANLLSNKLPQAMRFGSQEAVSFLNKQRIGRRDPQQQLLAVNNRQLDVQNDIAANLRQLNQNLLVEPAELLVA